MTMAASSSSSSSRLLKSYLLRPSAAGARRPSAAVVASRSLSLSGVARERSNVSRMQHASSAAFDQHHSSIYPPSTCSTLATRYPPVDYQYKSMSTVPADGNATSAPITSSSMPPVAANKVDEASVTPTAASTCTSTSTSTSTSTTSDSSSVETSKPVGRPVMRDGFAQNPSSHPKSHGFDERHGKGSKNKKRWRRGKQVAAKPTFDSEKGDGGIDVKAEEESVQEPAAEATGGSDNNIATSSASPSTNTPSPASSSPLRSRSNLDQSEVERVERLYNKIVFTPRGKLDQSLFVAAEGCLDILARTSPVKRGKLDRDDGNNADTSSPASMATRLLNRLKSEGTLPISGQIYEYTIQTLARQSGKAIEAGTLLQEYIATWRKEQEQQGSSMHNMKPPNSILISSVINAHAKDRKNSDPRAAQRAEELLKQMVKLHDDYADSDGASSFAPNTISFTSVIDAWSRRGNAVQAERLLDWMQDYAASHSTDQASMKNVTNAQTHNPTGYGRVNVRPNISTFNAVVAAWSRNAKINNSVYRKSSDPTEQARNAEKILQRMLDTANVQPDVFTYASVLSSWANCKKQPYGARRADDILLQMEQALDDSFLEPTVVSSSTTAAVPNVVCYNTVLHGWSNAGDPHRAEDLLCRMVDRNERYPLVAPAPNVASFNVAVLAWARSGREDAGRKAQDLLEAMEGMAAAAANGEEGKSGGREESTVRADIITFNTVLDGWLHGATIEHALRAEELLNSMERGERSVKPDRISFNTVIAAWAKAGQGKWRRQNSHDRRSRTPHVISDNDINPAQRAEDILHRMDAAGVQPDTISFNSCISAWSRSGRGAEAADRAETLLLAMEQLNEQDRKEGTNKGLVHPDAITYSAVIDAIARSGDRDAPFRAEAILARMETMACFKMSRAKPNIYTYNSIINCWAKSARDIYEAAQKADDILYRMEQGGHNLPRPDLVTYCTVINAWSRCSNPDKAEKARHVLDRMLVSDASDWNDSNTSVIRNAHNMVLNSCAYTPKEANDHAREMARQIAIQTYDDLHSSDMAQPNDVTYCNFLLVCSHLFHKDSHERARLIEAVMKDCIDRGLVSDQVLERMERVASDELRARFMASIGGDR